jgi:hypothetical protein
MDLKKVLDDIQEVLQILDQAEREKNGTEDEIEQLRDSLRTLQREPSHSRPRNFPPRPHVQPPPPSSSSSSEPEETSERDEGI